MAKLTVLTRACQLAKDQRVSVRTHSRYAFGVVHGFGMLWKQRGFLTSAGTPIKHEQQVKELLGALLLSREVTIIRVEPM